MKREWMQIRLDEVDRLRWFSIRTGGIAHSIYDIELIDKGGLDVSRRFYAIYNK